VEVTRLGQFYVGRIRVRSREDFAALTKFLEMGNQGAMKVEFGLGPRVTCGNAARHIRRIG
jgi:hypothetical protein